MPSNIFSATTSGLSGNTIISATTISLNSGSTRTATLNINNGLESTNVSLTQYPKPTISRNGSGVIDASGGTVSFSVNSAYQFFFRNAPSNVSDITSSGQSYISGNVPAGAYDFSASISSNPTSSTTSGDIEIAFQRYDGTYSYNRPDAGDFKFSFSQSGSTQPTPPQPTGSTVVPVYFDYDGEGYIYIALGEAVPFQVEAHIQLTYFNGNNELTTATIPANTDRVIWTNFRGNPIDFSIFDTIQTVNYASITNLDINNEGPEATVTYNNTSYYLYWSEDDSATFRTYLENVNNFSLNDVEWGDPYQPQPGPIDYENEYFTIEMLSAGTITWLVPYSWSDGVDYSINGSTWTPYYYTSQSPEPIRISANQGDKVRFRGVHSSYGVNGPSPSVPFNVYGNIMSLIYGDNFSGQTTISTTDAFYSFLSYRNVVSAKHLVLPATTISEGCYREMFWRSSNLIEAPEQLPATTLGEKCYQNMFWACSSLIDVPSVLPASVLSDLCYDGMFKDCTSLAEVPIVSATTVASGSCYQMFANCTSLTSVPSNMLPATGTVYNSGHYCYKGMFQGCTGLTVAPDLPMKLINWNGYYEDMFSGCTSLSYIDSYATSVSTAATKNWVAGVSPSGTFVKREGASWTTGVNGIPSGWSIQFA